MSDKVVTGPWSQEEDRLLIYAMTRHNGPGLDWKHIATLVPGRTNKACRKRWLHSLCPTIKKSSWTPEEDRKLVELHRTYGNKWSTIARFIQGRTDDACSKRFREALDPKLKKDEWTAEEDAQLLEAQKRLGCKWREVGEEMQRGSLACRNRFRLLERRGPSKDPDTVDNAELDPASFAGPSNSEDSPEVQYVPPDAYHLPAVELAIPFEDVSRSSPAPSAQHGHVHAPFRYTSSSLHAALQEPPPNQPDFWPSFLREFKEDALNVSMFDSMASDVSNGSMYFPMDFAPEPSSDDFSRPMDAVYSSPMSSPETTPFTATMPLQMSGTDPPPPNAAPSMTSNTNWRKRPASSSDLGLTRRRRFHSSDVETRLSATKPVNSEIKAYACGHPLCWPNEQTRSAACFSTSGDLVEHNKEHEADTYEEKPYRCALCGFDKKWKSINGLQYHLQVSTAHFQDALKTSAIEIPAADKANLYVCDRPGCTKAYKHLSGLSYHTKHGHPQKQPQQLSEVPLSIAARLKERQQKRRGAT